MCAASSDKHALALAIFGGDAAQRDASSDNHRSSMEEAMRKNGCAPIHAVHGQDAAMQMAHTYICTYMCGKAKCYACVHCHGP